MPAAAKELFLLVESAAGYLLARVHEWDAVAAELADVQARLLDGAAFERAVAMKATFPFSTAEEALENCEALTAGVPTGALLNFLRQNLPRKKKKYELGVIDPTLAKSLKAEDFPVLYDKNVLEMTRLCRFHMDRLMKHFEARNLLKFQVGLGHSVSRSKLQTDPRRQDKSVQGAVKVLEHSDKVINMFAMRLREWYAWHFPELAKLVPDNVKFAEVAVLLGAKDSFDGEARLAELAAVVDGDEALAREIVAAKAVSTGQDMSEADIENIRLFGAQLLRLAAQRRQLAAYMGSTLGNVAPNLQVLCGDVLAAKLIAHSGSLTNLAKAPASTLQILGAEKALFRALKSRGNTPKYGLIFQSTFIGRAVLKNKGRMSRYLANKCSIASRIDNFAAKPSSVYGTHLRDQVEARLMHLAGGGAAPPKANLAVVREAAAEEAALQPEAAEPATAAAGAAVEAS